MQKRSLKALVVQLRITVLLFVLSLFALLLLSFSTARFYADVFAKLGLTKQQTEHSITRSFLAGYLDYVEAKNLKKIFLNDRAGIVTDLGNYAKEYVKSPAFIKEYNNYREGYKPAPPQKIQTADELRTESISRLNETIKKMEADIRKANAQMKPIFENIQAEAKKQLAEYQDPNNKMLLTYQKNYPATILLIEEGYKKQLQNWESEYPGNHLIFVKKRLHQFLAETESIDFNAELFEKNGIQYFVKREYESKGSRWKMAYRAGKEMVDAGRKIAKDWIIEIETK